MIKQRGRKCPNSYLFEIVGYRVVLDEVKRLKSVVITSTLKERLFKAALVDGLSRELGGAIGLSLGDRSIVHFIAAQFQVGTNNVTQQFGCDLFAVAFLLD